MKRKIRTTETKGFTLVEVMVAAFFLGIALIGILGSIVSNTVLVGVNNDKSLALYELQAIAEEIENSDIEGIINTNWQDWAQTRLSMALRNETVSVTFPDGTTSDPLKVNISISWQYKQMPLSVSLEFLKAG